MNRIKVCVYGEIKYGVIVRKGKSVSMVKLDGAKKNTWFHNESLYRR